VRDTSPGEELSLTPDFNVIMNFVILIILCSVTAVLRECTLADGAQH